MTTIRTTFTPPVGGVAMTTVSAGNHVLPIGVAGMAQPIAVTVISRGLTGPPGDKGAPGPPGPPAPTGAGGDLHYTHTQAIPAASWVITHNLNKFPAVSVVDSSGGEVEGEVTHDSVNQLTVNFSAGFSGSAHLN